MYDISVVKSSNKYIFQNVRCAMEHHEGHNQQMEKMEHITKNRTSLENLQKNKTKSYQEGC